MRWRIGDGSSIQVLDQPWLLTDENPYVTSIQEPLQGKTVVSVMCVNSKEWDVKVVRDVLNDRDQKYVLAIPLTLSNHDDRLYWRLEESGNYTVKSAYKLLQSQRGMWNAEDCDKIWQVQWRTKAPPKALNLVWRALADCLPTLAQLHKKKVPVNTICLVCHQEEESILHSLVTCHYAQQSWLLLLPEINYHTASCFKAWLWSVFNDVDKRKQAEVITLCWAIWRSRNDLIGTKKLHR